MIGCLVLPTAPMTVPLRTARAACASIAFGLVACASIAGAAEVRVVERDGRQSLEIDGEPFVVRGAGLEGRDAEEVEFLADALARAGGNAFRTWNPDGADAALAAAGRHGLRVLLGVGLAPEVGGFDYDDEGPPSPASTPPRRRSSTVTATTRTCSAGSSRTSPTSRSPPTARRGWRTRGCTTR